MNINKRVALATTLISSFIFLIFLLLISYQPLFGNQVPAVLVPLISYHMEFMIGTTLLGVAVGAAVFYLMQEKVETKEKESKITAGLLLSFLKSDERKAIEYLVKSNGAAYQSEIGRVEGMSRLKAYRAITRLEKAGVLTVQANGKIRKVVLVPAIFDALHSDLSEKAK
ncbi:MAG: hypothetical protein V1492_05935 [Candidatus Micrarchaeota archaeon]